MYGCFILFTIIIIIIIVAIIVVTVIVVLQLLNTSIVFICIRVLLLSAALRHASPLGGTRPTTLICPADDRVQFRPGTAGRRVVPTCLRCPRGRRSDGAIRRDDAIDTGIWYRDRFRVTAGVPELVSLGSGRRREPKPIFPFGDG